MLERYGHGGDLRSAAELYGRKEEELLDYSSNMNPLGPPPAFQAIIEQYWQFIAAYPDPAQRDLLEAIAHRHQVEPASIIAGNGAAELIDLVVRYINPVKAAVFLPSFVEYEQAIAKAKCECVYIATEEQQQFNPTMAQLQHLIEKEQPQLVMLGYPNNPTGALMPSEQLDYLLDSGIYVVVDEAFLDFHLEEERLTAISKLPRYEKLFVIRSMTKFYSMPGIRLGYMLAAVKHITALKQLQVPWSVNSLAQQLGVAALQQESFAEQTKRWLAEENAWLSAQLRQLKLQVYPSVTNYMLARLPMECKLTSGQLQQLMGQRGILIRDAGKFRGLDASYIRLAIKERASNERLLQELKHVLAQQQVEAANEI